MGCCYGCHCFNSVTHSTGGLSFWCMMLLHYQMQCIMKNGYIPVLWQHYSRYIVIVPGGDETGTYRQQRLVRWCSVEETVTVYHEVGSWYIVSVPGGDETNTYRQQRLVSWCSCWRDGHCIIWGRYIVTVLGGDEMGTYRQQRLVRWYFVEEIVTVYSK